MESNLGDRLCHGKKAAVAKAWRTACRGCSPDKCKKGPNAHSVEAYTCRIGLSKEEGGGRVSGDGKHLSLDSRRALRTGREIIILWSVAAHLWLRRGT